VWFTVIGGTGVEEDIVSDGAGFFYVAGVRGDDADGGSVGVDKNIFKINALTGAIVARYDTGADFSGLGVRLAVDSSGDLLVTQKTPTVPEDGGAAANVFKLDSSLTLLARANIDWATKIGASASFGPRFVHVTTDSSDRVYVVTSNGFLVRLSSDLSTEQVSMFLTGIGAPLGNANSFAINQNIGHDQANQLIVFCNVPRTSAQRSVVLRYDNDGVLIRKFEVPLPGQAMVGRGHVLPGAGGGPGPDIGTAFTSELSQNPPGRIQAIAAVKFDAGNIVSIFFNSVDVEFKPLEWTAVHSVQGPMTIAPHAPGWEYNSPL